MSASEACLPAPADCPLPLYVATGRLEEEGRILLFQRRPGQRQRSIKAKRRNRGGEGKVVESFGRTCSFLLRNVPPPLVLSDRFACLLRRAEGGRGCHSLQRTRFPGCLFFSPALFVLPLLLFFAAWPPPPLLVAFLARVYYCIGAQQPASSSPPRGRPLALSSSDSARPPTRCSSSPSS